MKPAKDNFWKEVATRLQHSLLEEGEDLQDGEPNGPPLTYEEWMELVNDPVLPLHHPEVKYTKKEE